jgi:hypothetical protein
VGRVMIDGPEGCGGDDADAAARALDGKREDEEGFAPRKYSAPQPRKKRTNTVNFK